MRHFALTAGRKVLGFSLPCLRQQEGVGPPRKPLPRKKIPANLRSLARGHTDLCVKVLAGIVSQEAVPPAARVSAAGILLDRGWGRAPQPHAGEDGKDIHVTIRKIRRRLGLTSICHSTARVDSSIRIICRSSVAAKTNAFGTGAILGPRRTTMPQLVPFAIATWVGAWVTAAKNDFYQLNQWSEEDSPLRQHPFADVRGRSETSKSGHERR